MFLGNKHMQGARVHFVGSVAIVAGIEQANPVDARTPIAFRFIEYSFLSNRNKLCLL